MIPLLKSISNSSPFSIAFAASSHSIIGNPIFIEFLKNILAKVDAITQLIPLDFIASGACSLDEPQPKFFFATIISPLLTFFAKFLSISSIQWIANSLGSAVFKYLAGIITSVSTLSPYLKTLPLAFI